MTFDRRGFSLIEMLIVVALLGIIAAIAIPTYMGIQKKGKRVEYKSNLEIIKLLEEKRRAERGQYVPATDTVDLMAAFPDFQPGDPAELRYEYSVTCTDPRLDFTATAEGKPGTSDEGNKFCINQDNERFEDAGCP
jgi:prepilin-type N-terminal cleavage/methylation domain-containing protein